MNTEHERELYETVNRSVPSILIETVEVSDGHATVVLQNRDDVHGAEHYFLTLNKQQKILAIETTRWFRDLPWLTSLRVTVPGAETVSRTLDRDRVEHWWGFDFERMRNDETRELWRAFLREHDHQVSRVRFVDEMRHGQNAGSGA